MSQVLHDAITDVAGLAVGHFTHAERATGCTVVLCPQGAVAGVDVRGGSPGTRETDLLRPENVVDRVHAVLLAGHLYDRPRLDALLAYARAQARSPAVMARMLWGFITSSVSAEL